MSIRVVYLFDVSTQDEAQFVNAWHQIVEAHSGHGALGSMLLRSQDEPGRWRAISRWESRTSWEDNRTDGAAPDAYKVFRQCVTVVSKEVYDEIAVV